MTIVDAICELATALENESGVKLTRLTLSERHFEALRKEANKACGFVSGGPWNAGVIGVGGVDVHLERRGAGEGT